MRKSILGMVLAGGEGRRLSPLTVRRAKPAVPFGGKYRIIDFVLSNFVNSGINKVFVITQFRSQSLSEHINSGWNITNNINNQFITPVPAQMKGSNKSWYEGTADAIWQNIDLVNVHQPDLLAVFGGDHIYKMDISEMKNYHIEKEALATVSAIPVPIEEGTEFGIIQVDRDGRIIGFEEKPEKPKCIPGQPDMCLASMGNYIFDTEWALGMLGEDSKDTISSHDFGNDILPRAVETGKVFAYDFSKNSVAGNYWRDVGTLKAFYEANMDLRQVDPQLNMYCPKWPIHTTTQNLPPAKFVLDGGRRVGKAVSSIVCDGCIISGASVHNSILSPGVRVDEHASVDDSIIMDKVHIAEGCRVKHAIIDRNVILPPGTEIGFNKEEDEKKFKVIDMEDGRWLTVIEKNYNYLNFAL